MRRVLERHAKDGEIRACYEASGAGYVLQRATRLVARADLAVLRVTLEHAPQLPEVVRVLVAARGDFGVRGEDGDGPRVLVDVEAEVDDTG